MISQCHSNLKGRSIVFSKFMHKDSFPLYPRLIFEQPVATESNLPSDQNQLWMKMDHGDETAWIALMNMRYRGNCFSPVSLDVHQKAIHHDNVDARNPITFIAEANTTATSNRSFSPFFILSARSG